MTQLVARPPRRRREALQIVLVLVQVESVVQADRTQDVVANIVRAGLQQGGADFGRVATRVPHAQDVAQLDVLDGGVVNLVVFLAGGKGVWFKIPNLCFWNF